MCQMAISIENHLDRRWFLVLALKMEQYELRSHVRCRCWLIDWNYLRLKKEKNYARFYLAGKRFFFMMWLWSKKQNAPLFTTFVVTCIHVPSLRYTRGLGWRMHCGVEVTESSTNKQHHPLHNFCVYIYIHILYFRTRAGSGLRAWCMCCGCRV